MFLSRVNPPRSVILGVVLFLVSVPLLLQFRHLPAWPSTSLRLQTDSADVQFWKTVSALLASATPKCRPLRRSCSAGALYWRHDDSSIAGLRQECIEMSEEEVGAMRASHQTFVQGIANTSLQMVYNQGTQGLVSTSSTRLLPNLVISLRMLRKTGCQLPMEVFVSTQQEWETYICETVLPSLNARCIVKSIHLRTTVDTGPLSNYYSKIAAILTSTFEDLLFLDADCWPVRDPTQIFTSEPFLSAGLITFPDYWRSTTSPHFYDITQQDLPTLDLHRTTESGQIFLSKKSHAWTLLLALYYNHFGKQFYYPLLTQGGPGEGDKETFLAAAQFFNASFYFVHHPVQSLGNPISANEVGSAMVQYDPMDDYAITKTANQNNPQNPLPPSSSPLPSAAAARPLFVHNNFPKINPYLIWNEDAYIIHDNDWNLKRPWTSKEAILDAFGYDIQRSLWEEVLFVGCNLEDKFQWWEGVDGICENTRAYFDEFFGKE